MPGRRSGWNAMAAGRDLRRTGSSRPTRARGSLPDGPGCWPGQGDSSRGARGLGRSDRRGAGSSGDARLTLRDSPGAASSGSTRPPCGAAARKPARLGGARVVLAGRQIDLTHRRSAGAVDASLARGLRARARGQGRLRCSTRPTIGSCWRGACSARPSCRGRDTGSRPSADRVAETVTGIRRPSGS